MTVDEFLTEARIVLGTRELKNWERYDFSILVRMVQKNNRVTSTEILVLKMMGKPTHGNGNFPKTKIPKPRKMVQDKLF